MTTLDRSAAAIAWDGAALRILDQTRLPFEEVVLELGDPAAVAEAIGGLAVRGEPNIGIAGAYGMALAPPDPAGRDAAADLLRGARPTARNLSWAVDRVHAAGPEEAEAEARRIHAEEDAAAEAVATRGADLLAPARRLLTICNTGALACGGRGSALGVIAELAERHQGTSVLACETRPLLQGARLTVWELRRLGIAHHLIADSAAAGLIRRGDADAVITGFDRMAANGDLANKVGTYGLALAARAAGIPFVVAGPTSTIDTDLPDGDGIVVEERAPGEVLTAGGAPVALPGTPVRNPAFDVTPAELVTALVTDRGVAAPLSAATLAPLLP